MSTKGCNYAVVATSLRPEAVSISSNGRVRWSNRDGLLSSHPSPRPHACWTKLLTQSALKIFRRWESGGLWFHRLDIFSASKQFQAQCGARRRFWPFWLYQLCTIMSFLRSRNVLRQRHSNRSLNSITSGSQPTAFAVTGRDTGQLATITRRKSTREMAGMEYSRQHWFSTTKGSRANRSGFPAGSSGSSPEELLGSPVGQFVKFECRFCGKNLKSEAGRATHERYYQGVREMASIAVGAATVR